MAINPKEYMLNLRGKEYLPVAPRIVMFREAHPEWCISTETIVFGDVPLVRASVYNESGVLIATAHKTVTSFKGGSIEKAETGAIGRAISLCGFGTIQAGDMDEEDEISDAPVTRRSATRKNQDDWQTRLIEFAAGEGVPRETVVDYLGKNKVAQPRTLQDAKALVAMMAE